MNAMTELTGLNAVEKALVFGTLADALRVACNPAAVYASTFVPSSTSNAATVAPKGK